MISGNFIFIFLNCVSAIHVCMILRMMVKFPSIGHLFWPCVLFLLVYYN